MYLFDLDGTLLDSNGVWLDIDLEFLGRRGIPVTQDYTDYVTHHSAPQAALYTRERYHLPESPQEIMDAWADMAREAYAHRLPLKPGARSFLLRCRREGRRMALLTSCIPQLCRSALAHHGLEDLFEAVFTTGELGMEKRYSDTYRQVALRCGVDPEECTFFDDSPVYLSAAREAGMTTVGVYDPLFNGRAQEIRQACHHYWLTFPGEGISLP